MKKVFGFGCVALALFLQIPGEVSAQKGKRPGTADAASPDEYKSVMHYPTLNATVVSADTGTIVVKVDMPAPVGAAANNNNNNNNNNNKTNTQQTKVNQAQMKLQQD